MAAKERPLTDPKALDLFLRARHEVEKRWPGAFTRAIALLEQARKTAPADPLIISLLAVANAMTLTITNDAGALERPEALAARARALAPERAEGYLAIGAVAMQRGEEDVAAKHLATCLELAPSLARRTRTLDRCSQRAVRFAYDMRAVAWRSYFASVPRQNFHWLSRCRVAL